jgi:PhnB protein
MADNFKPAGYNSVSAYFIVAGAQQFIDMLKQLFHAEELRRYDMPDGTIMHAEVRIDDTVIMIGDASEQFPPNKQLLHVYVPDVDFTFRKALALSCVAIEYPTEKEDDPDRRGTFSDFAGNIWSVGTQMHKKN